MCRMAEAAVALKGTSIRSTPISRRVIETSPDLRIVAKYTIGVDDVDVAAATENGVLVTHSPTESNWGGVAEGTMAMMLAAVDMIGGGVCQRFPDLRIGFLEGNCSWAPFLFWRLDEHHEWRHEWEGKELKLKPSEYFRRQCFLSIECDETPAKYAVDTFGGGNIDAAVKRTVGLLEAARRLGMPVAFTRIMYAEDGSNAGVFCLKAPKLKELTMSNPLSHIVPELTPIDGEVIIDKTEASAFFGTSFAAWLAYRRVDTLIVAGATTSGCVRATVLDAFSSNYRLAVVEDACFDRSQASHAINLCDMNAKYADVVMSDDALAFIATLDEGLFDLPTGVPPQ